MRKNKRIKIVIYDDTHQKEFSTHIKQVEDAVREMNSYVKTKYYGGRRRCS